MGRLDKHYLVRFARKTGKIDLTMESLGSAQLRFIALTKTTKSRDCIIFNGVTGEVVYYAEGDKSGFPKITEEGLGHIDKYCPGLLVELQKEGA